MATDEFSSHKNTDTSETSKKANDENSKLGADDTEKATRHLGQVVEHNYAMLKDIPNLFHDTVIPEKNVIFCIDTSGSMYHLLDTVKEHLFEAIVKHAAKDNSPAFNIIEFSTSVTVWCDKMVPCSDSTLKAAKRWLGLLSAKTGTNTRDALLTAFEFADCEAVYIVSDGLPDSRVDDLLHCVGRASRGRPVHVTYVCEVTQDPAVYNVLRKIAKSTEGHFRVVAFGLNGPLQRASLIVNELAPSKQQTIELEDDTMCGVQIYEAGEPYRPLSRSGRATSLAQPGATASRTDSATGEKNSKMQSMRSQEKINWQRQTERIPFHMPVYPTVAECHCYDEELHVTPVRNETVRKHVRMSEPPDDEEYPSTRVQANGRRSAGSRMSRTGSSERNAGGHRSASASSDALDAAYPRHGILRRTDRSAAERCECKCECKLHHTRVSCESDDDCGVRQRRDSIDRVCESCARRRRKHLRRHEKEHQSRKKTKAKSANWYEQAARVIHRSRSASTDSCWSRSPSVSSIELHCDHEERRRHHKADFCRCKAHCENEFVERHCRFDDLHSTGHHSPPPYAGPSERPHRRCKSPSSQKPSSSSFGACRDPARPFDSIEFHRIRATSAKQPAKLDHQKEKLNQRQRGYLDREQRVLQRRVEEALRLESERKLKLDVKLQRERQAILREQNASRLENERSAFREQSARQRATWQAERTQRESNVLQQREMLRTRLVTDQNAAQQLRERRAEQYAERVREHKRQQFTEQQLRLARIACEERARLPSELARTNTEVVLGLRKHFDTPKESSNAGKSRVDPTRA